MSRLFRAPCLAATVLVIAAVGARAQSSAEAAAFAATTLKLTAYGDTQVPPDQATLDLGVQTTAATARDAMGQTAARMAQVVAALKSAGIESRDLTTSNLSLSPQYAYEANRPPRLTGYQAANQVTVTVRDLSRLGPVADAVVAAGANTVGQIEFGLANPLAAENVARVAAVKALEDKAALYANAVGYRINRLVNLSEGTSFSPRPQPMPMLAMRAEAPTPTPVEAGDLKVRVDVTGLFELTR